MSDSNGMKLNMKANSYLAMVYLLRVKLELKSIKNFVANAL